MKWAVDIVIVWFIDTVIGECNPLARGLTGISLYCPEHTHVASEDF